MTRLHCVTAAVVKARAAVEDQHRPRRIAQLYKLAFGDDGIHPVVIDSVAAFLRMIIAETGFGLCRHGLGQETKRSPLHSDLSQDDYHIDHRLIVIVEMKELALPGLSVRSFVELVPGLYEPHAVGF